MAQSVDSATPSSRAGWAYTVFCVFTAHPATCTGSGAPLFEKKKSTNSLKGLLPLLSSLVMLKVFEVCLFFNFFNLSVWGLSHLTDLLVQG